MAKNIVVCCDGTGNEIERNLSNVLKLFRIAARNDEQRVYYNAGIGTIGSSDAWARIRQNVKSVFNLATGRGLDEDILGPYEFICRHFEDGDAIFLFGFSRGAYTARAVAGMIHMIGLLPADQLNIADYALRAYKQANEDNDLGIAWRFSDVSGALKARIRFLGVWDTVASFLVPRKDRLVPQLLTLPHTRRNPSVEVFRHAIAIDERRRMFRLNRWKEPQLFVKNPFDKKAEEVRQDIKQVWFAGVHGDIGGGYPEEESGLAKFPLDWMIREASSHGLKINATTRNRIALGQAQPGAKATYMAPDHTADAHDSMTWGWRPLDWLPKSAKRREWPRRKLAGLYLPQAEPRLIENAETRPLVHQSVIDRMRDTPYRPENFPAAYDVEQ